jgi:hypothetical protein
MVEYVPEEQNVPMCRAEIEYEVINQCSSHLVDMPKGQIT